MDVSIIIVNYNTLALTQQCIDSIFSQTYSLEFEVILVDNGSTDGSKEHFEKDKRISYIYSKENLGFGRANNLGYTKAKGDFLFLLNSDTYLQNNAVYLLWKGIKEENERTHDVACAGCMLRNKEGKIIHSYAKFPSMISTVFGCSIYVILWKLHIIKSLPSSDNYEYNLRKDSTAFDVDYITGAALMVPRNIANRHGLFSPDFFMYYEETEMEHRYMKYGLRRIILISPQIVHLVGKSNTKDSPKRATMVIRSHFLYFKKTSRCVAYAFYKPIFKFAYITTYAICFPFVHGGNKAKWNHLVSVLKM